MICSEKALGPFAATCIGTVPYASVLSHDLSRLSREAGYVPKSPSDQRADRWPLLAPSLMPSARVEPGQNDLGRDWIPLIEVDRGANLGSHELTLLSYPLIVQNVD